MVVPHMRTAALRQPEPELERARQQPAAQEPARECSERLEVWAVVSAAAAAATGQEQGRGRGRSRQRPWSVPVRSEQCVVVLRVYRSAPAAVVEAVAAGERERELNTSTAQTVVAVAGTVHMVLASAAVART